MLVYDHIDRSANTKDWLANISQVLTAEWDLWKYSLRVLLIQVKEWSLSSSNIARNQLHIILLHPTTCRTHFWFVFGSVDNRLLAYTWKRLIVLVVSPRRLSKIIPFHSQWILHNTQLPITISRKTVNLSSSSWNLIRQIHRCPLTSKKIIWLSLESKLNYIL